MVRIRILIVSLLSGATRRARHVHGLAVARGAARDRVIPWGNTGMEGTARGGGGGANLLAARLKLDADLVPSFACSIAWEPAREPVTTICAHVFEKKSLVQWYSLHRMEMLCGKCPICAHELSDPKDLRVDRALEAAAQKARAAARPPAFFVPRTPVQKSTLFSFRN